MADLGWQPNAAGAFVGLLEQRESGQRNGAFGKDRDISLGR